DGAETIDTTPPSRRTRRLRDAERTATSSVLLLPSPASTNPSVQRGDYGQPLPLGEAFGPAED
ncbi:jg22990, partial [Pararge aegeria aegeria]